MPSERTLTIAAIALVVFAILAFAAAVVLKGGVLALQAPSVVGLVGFVSTLLGILVAILKVDQLNQKMNGHIAAHEDAAAAKATAGTNAQGNPAEPPTLPPVAGE